MKNVIITGTSRGIGFELAKKFLKNNYKVYGSSRTGKTEIIDSNFECLTLDLSDINSIKNFENQLVAKNIRIDLLINNAGIGPDLDYEKPEIKSFESTFQVNVIGTTFLTETLIKQLNENADILMISSKMGSLNLCRLSDSIAYRMSKTAINMYTKTLANRLNGKHNVASLHPGWVKTTIAKSNVNGRLTSVESAEKIFKFVNNNLKNGIFWNAETECECEW